MSISPFAYCFPSGVSDAALLEGVLIDLKGWYLLLTMGTFF